jgi:3-oxoacyl-(acyl-carrier-protein) synthase
MTTKRRVCITGIGMVSPLGNDRESTWRRVLAGDSGAGAITQFHAKTWPTTFACEVSNFNLSRDAIPAEHRLYLNRPSEFGVEAALEAMCDSGLISAGALTGAATGSLEEFYSPERFGVSIGASIGAISPHALAKMLVGMEVKEGLPQLSSTIERAEGTNIVLKNHPGTLAALLSARWHAYGPVTTIHTACASSGQSLGQAYLQIQRGEADVMLAGGADSLAGELLLAGFCLLGALSRRNEDPLAASRPFDRERDGFVASEGAAMLVLEEYSRAVARGARIYAEFAGYGETESAYRITDLPENGRGIVEAMSLAVKDAGLALEDINYINAHGTSTELNDRVEALAVRRLFGARGVKPMVSSTKSETGHLISAAGAMEAAFSTLSVYEGKVPPTRNLYNTDCGDDIDFIANTMREKPIYAALSNSVGFGGSNSVIAIKRCGT